MLHASFLRKTSSNVIHDVITRDDLVNFLRPFAQDGKVVDETDVRDFFATLTEAAKKGRL